MKKLLPLPLHLVYSAGLIVCGLLAAGCADAQPGGGSTVATEWQLELSRQRWSVTGNLLAPGNISGIATLDGESFVIGSDDLVVAQYGKIDRIQKRLAINGTIQLADEKDDEIDIEGVAAAAAERCYYVTGSHSVTKKGNMKKERRSVYRVAMDANGKPHGKIERESLRDIIKRDAILRQFWEKPQQIGGVNIEGLAWKDGELWFGLRSPNVDDHALVLQVNANGLFRKGRDPHKLIHVPLGDGLGIREMVAIQEGFLVVAGNAGDEPTADYPVPRDYRKNRLYQLFFWNPDNNRATVLGPFPRVPGRPEALLVLADSSAATEFLVLFDGVTGGIPMHYFLKKGK